MKKYILMLIVLAFILSLYAEIIYVPDDYPTIQLAVNAVSPGDEIIVRDGTYQGNITIATGNIVLRSENGHSDCIIDCYSQSRAITIEPFCPVQINGFTIQNGEDTSGGAIFFNTSALILIRNCIFQNNKAILSGGAIFAMGDGQIILNNNIFKNNYLTHQNSVFGEGHAISIYGDYRGNPARIITVSNNLFSENKNTNNFFGAAFTLMECNYNTTIGFYDNTFDNNLVRGLWIDLIPGTVIIKNSIFSNHIYAAIEVAWVQYLGIEYCNFFNDPLVGCSAGTSCISEDPIFCEAEEYEYYLLEGSPCIDAGDPTMTDLDGTRRDMGCYPSITDVKKCEGNHWNWVSFPRLDRINNDPVLAPPVLGQFLDWPFGLELLYDDNLIPVLVYDPPDWIPGDYEICSSLGYKLDPQSAGDHYLPLEGSRLVADYQLTYSLEPGTYHWLGYWLPESQNIVNAFGDLWQYVEKVKSEDWYYNKCSIIRGGDPSVPVSWSTKGKTLEYGKGYMVWFKDETIPNFHWTSSGDSEKPEERDKSENFTYTEKPDYEVIDVVDIPENVLEIGLFENDECVGAVVVQDSCEQILVYSDNVLRDPIPFNFEVVTGRGQSTSIKNYEVFNPSTGEFEPGIIISGMQEYSLVKLGEQGEPDDNTPEIKKLELHSNYPNPFNPTTTISFSVTQTSPFVTLEIFSIKGQKVKTLYKGKAEEGKHIVTWNGEDENDKPVSSGIYFYKLKAGEKEISRKMLLLK